MPQLNRDPLAARSRGPLQQHTLPPGAAQGRRAPRHPSRGSRQGPPTAAEGTGRPGVALGRLSFGVWSQAWKSLGI